MYYCLGGHSTQKALNVLWRYKLVRRLCTSEMGTVSFHIPIEFINSRKNFQRRIPADEGCHTQVEGKDDRAFKYLGQISGKRPLENSVDEIRAEPAFFRRAGLRNAE